MQWINDALYTYLWYISLLILVSFACLSIVTRNALRLRGYASTMFLGLYAVWYIGNRPLLGEYMDMIQYSWDFELVQRGYRVEYQDLIWNFFINSMGRIVTMKQFFVICSFLYVYPLYLSIRKLSLQNPYVLFLMILVSFSFWGYGVNGIRNGIATSLVIAAFAFHERKPLSLGILVLAFGFHGSVIIPLIGYLLSFTRLNLVKYLRFWVLAIPLSLIFGGILELLIGQLNWIDNRVSYLDSNFNGGTFRWDFLLYSTAGVLAITYNLRRGFKDVFYDHISKVYLFSNGLWVLLIRANFTNRFAYLSWFLLAFVIFYPTSLGSESRYNTLILSLCVIVYAGFTFVYFL